MIPDFGDREGQIAIMFLVSNEHNSDIRFEEMPTVFSVTLQKVQCDKGNVTWIVTLCM